MVAARERFWAASCWSLADVPSSLLLPESDFLSCLPLPCATTPLSSVVSTGGGVTSAGSIPGSLVASVAAGVPVSVAGDAVATCGWTIGASCNVAASKSAKGEVSAPASRGSALAAAVPALLEAAIMLVESADKIQTQIFRRLHPCTAVAPPMTKQGPDHTVCR